MAESSTSVDARVDKRRRSSTSFVTPMAAAQSRRPDASFAEFGYLSTFSMSFIVIRPCRRKFSSTMGSFLYGSQEDGLGFVGASCRQGR